MKSLLVRASWDPESSVWVATSEDVPGLVTEADTMSALLAKLKVMVPEMLDENGHPDGDDVHTFRVVSECEVAFDRLPA